MKHERQIRPASPAIVIIAATIVGGMGMFIIVLLLIAAGFAYRGFTVGGADPLRNPPGWNTALIMGVGMTLMYGWVPAIISGAIGTIGGLIVGLGLFVTRRFSSQSSGD